MISTLDSKLLLKLMNAGRSTWAELGATVKLTAPAVAERIRKLEERGVIRGYAALVDPVQTGFSLTAFVAVTLDRPQHRKGFTAALAKMGEVVEIHHVAGDSDYLLKVRCQSTAGLDDLLSNRIKELPGIARTRTTIVLGTLKETVVAPISITC
jgi:Lrp/AsnC family transcriptional regulator, leucine-responsive regulatory protein